MNHILPSDRYLSGKPWDDFMFEYIRVNDLAEGTVIFWFFASQIYKVAVIDNSKIYISEDLPESGELDIFAENIGVECVRDFMNNYKSNDELFAMNGTIDVSYGERYFPSVLYRRFIMVLIYKEQRVMRFWLHWVSSEIERMREYPCVFKILEMMNGEPILPHNGD